MLPLVVWIVLASANQTLDDLETQITHLQKELENYSKARKALLTEDKYASMELPPISPLPVEVEPQDWLLPNFIPKAQIYTNHTSSVELLTLKPIVSFRDVVNSLNIAVVVCDNSGDLLVFENSGELLYRLHIGYEAKLVSTTTSYDEIKIAIVNPKNYLEVYSVFMDRLRKNSTNTIHHYGVQSQKVNMTIFLESKDRIHHPATSLLYYVKSGKKFWVVGDQEGGISLHMLNGTAIKRGEVTKGKVTSLDRFGQMLAFSTEQGVGVVNTNTMNLQQYCEGASSPINYIAIDTSTSTSIVYAVQDNNDIVVFDTRYSHGNDYICKVLGKLHNPFAGSSMKLCTSKNYLTTFGSEGVLSFYNISAAKGEHSDPVHLKQVQQGKPFMKTLRVQTGGNLLVFGNEKELLVYEVTLPNKPTGGFEMGSMRVVM